MPSDARIASVKAQPVKTAFKPAPAPKPTTQKNLGGTFTPGGFVPNKPKITAPPDQAPYRHGQSPAQSAVRSLGASGDVNVVSQAQTNTDAQRYAQTKAMQRELVAHGYKIAVDGIMGPQTAKAYGSYFQSVGATGAQGHSLDASMHPGFMRLSTPGELEAQRQAAAKAYIEANSHQSITPGHVERGAGGDQSSTPFFKGQKPAYYLPTMAPKGEGMLPSVDAQTGTPVYVRQPAAPAPDLLSMELPQSVNQDFAKAGNPLLAGAASVAKQVVDAVPGSALLNQAAETGHVSLGAAASDAFNAATWLVGGAELKAAANVIRGADTVTHAIEVARAAKAAGRIVASPAIDTPASRDFYNALIQAGVPTKQVEDTLSIADYSAHILAAEHGITPQEAMNRVIATARHVSADPTKAEVGGMLAQGTKPEVANVAATPEAYLQHAAALERAAKSFPRNAALRAAAPEHAKTAKGMLALLTDLQRRAIEAADYRKWYEQSAKGIMDHVGGNTAEADKLAALVAVYSPRAQVYSTTSEWNNLDRAINAYNDFKQTGEISPRWGMGQAMTDKANAIMNGTFDWNGLKTNRFYRNFLQHIDPAKYESLWRGEKFTTQDTWMRRAFNYGVTTKVNKAGKALKQEPISPKMYEFMDRATKAVADSLGWTPDEAQAAIWTSIKSEAEGTPIADAGFNFQDAFAHRAERNAGVTPYDRFLHGVHTTFGGAPSPNEILTAGDRKAAESALSRMWNDMPTSHKAFVEDLAYQHSLVKNPQDVMTLFQDDSLVRHIAEAQGVKVSKPAGVFHEVSPEEGAAAIKRAYEENSRSWNLTPHTAEELKGSRVFLSPDGKAGYVINPKGDLQNVFNNSPEKGIVDKALAHAPSQGAKTLDAYDGFLPTYYERHGFRETGRMPFNPEYAPPGMPAEDIAKAPDVVFMAHRPDLPVGKSANVHDNWDKHAQDALDTANARVHAQPDMNWDGAAAAKAEFKDAITSAPKDFANTIKEIFFKPVSELRAEGHAAEGQVAQTEGTVKGAARVSPGKGADLYTYKRADVSTGLHEFFHAIEQHLPAEARAAIRDPEHGARSFEQYIANGEAPTKALQGVFDRLSGPVRQVYGHGAIPGADLTPELKTALDHFFAGQAGSHAALQELASHLLLQAGPPPEEGGGYGMTKAEMDKAAHDFMKGGIPGRNEQDISDKLERARRAVRAEAAMRDASEPDWQQREINALGELKGFLPVVKWEGHKSLTSETITAMINHVHALDNIGTYTKIRVTKAIQKTLGDRPPTASEMRDLERIFGPQPGLRMLKDEMPRWKHLLYEVLNVPRAVMASFDLSAPLRQGLILMSQHPIIGRHAAADMFKMFASEKFYTNFERGIKMRPNYVNGRYERMDLAITDMEHADTTAQEEEQFVAANLAEKIFSFAPWRNLPGQAKDARTASPIRWSGRAYTGFLVKLRTDVADHLLAEAEKARPGIADNQKFLTDLGNFINAATGRGQVLKKVEGSLDALNTVFFSPRLMASRMNFLNFVNPNNYYRLDPFVRKQKILAAMSTAGTVASFLTLAAQIPGVTVGLDPRSADFAKIKVGDTRMDIAGGFQQYIRLFSEIATLTRVSSTTGQSSSLWSRKFGAKNGLDTVLGFFEGKAAPLMGVGMDVLRGTDAVGNPITPWSEFSSHMFPLIGQDMASLYQDPPIHGMNPILAAFLGYGAETFGTGLQTYPPKVPGQAHLDKYTQLAKKVGLVIPAPILANMTHAAALRSISTAQTDKGKRLNAYIDYFAKETGNHSLDSWKDNMGAATKVEAIIRATLTPGASKYEKTIDSMAKAKGVK